MGTGHGPGKLGTEPGQTRRGMPRQDVFRPRRLGVPPLRRLGCPIWLRS
jgi:hypothetical protein